MRRLRVCVPATSSWQACCNLIQLSPALPSGPGAVRGGCGSTVAQAGLPTRGGGRCAASGTPGTEGVPRVSRAGPWAAACALVWAAAGAGTSCARMGAGLLPRGACSRLVCVCSPLLLFWLDRGARAQGPLRLRPLRVGVPARPNMPSLFSPAARESLSPPLACFYLLYYENVWAKFFWGGSHLPPGERRQSRDEAARILPRPAGTPYKTS
mmetsp:Transcript_49288/g.120172  ORF Transcript_49288/g.120172 Transcript_49288/m.120172 type:complete len:211 (-) Transcript_49288:1581-2213(-)